MEGTGLKQNAPGKKHQPKKLWPRRVAKGLKTTNYFGAKTSWGWKGSSIGNGVVNVEPELALGGGGAGDEKIALGRIQFGQRQGRALFAGQASEFNGFAVDVIHQRVGATNLKVEVGQRFNVLERLAE